jgi:esterase
MGFQRRITRVDRGMNTETLNTVVTGEATDKTPLLIVHGLFGSARNWGVVARRMAQERQVISVDMRNHGASFRSPSNSYDDMAADLARVIEARGGPMHVLGHSMGGKASMMLALRRADLVKRLIIADISPVAYGHTQISLVDAMQSLDVSQVEKRGDADRALTAAIPDGPVRAFLLQSFDVKGKKWLLNLDVLGAEMARVVGWPYPEGRFDGPSYFISGGDSTYVKPEHRADIKALFPAAKFAKIPGAGHWLHAEKPREFEAVLQSVLVD